MDGTDLQQQQYLYTYHTAHILGMISDSSTILSYMYMYLFNLLSYIMNGV